jgi:hypothetical protein
MMMRRRERANFVPSLNAGTGPPFADFVDPMYQLYPKMSKQVIFNSSIMPGSRRVDINALARILLAKF